MIRQDWSSLKKLLFFQMAAGGGAAVEATATGNPLTFLTDLARPLKSLLIPFAPVQSGSGDPSPENVRPITGWTGCNVYRTGKNLLHVNEQSLIFKSIARIEITYTETGCVIVVPQSQYSSFVLFEIMPITADMVGMQFIYSSTNVFNEDRIISCDIEGGNRSTIPNGIVRQIDVGKILALRIYPTGEGTYTISEMQMEIGTSSTAYSPYTGETIHVSFPSPVYGGYVDVVTGELWATHFGLDPQQCENIREDSSSQTVTVGRIAIAEEGFPAYKNTACISNRFSTNIPSGTAGRMVLTPSISSLYFVVSTSELDTSLSKNAMFLKWFEENPTVFCYETASPILINTLTPTQITALIGNNTIWSDADGSMTATYLKKG